MGNKKSLPVAIVGTGPAALMAAENLSELGHLVTVFEKRKGPGWKLLVAGSTGFNISNALPPKQFIEQYRGGSRHFWEKYIQSFSVNDWLYFIESKLKLKTFLGSSGN